MLCSLHAFYFVLAVVRHANLGDDEGSGRNEGIFGLSGGRTTSIEHILSKLDNSLSWTYRNSAICLAVLFQINKPSRMCSMLHSTIGLFFSSLSVHHQ